MGQVGASTSSAAILRAAESEERLEVPGDEGRTRDWWRGCGMLLVDMLGGVSSSSSSRRGSEVTTRERQGLWQA